LARFILHVWTADPFKTPWALHIDGGPPIQLQEVFIWVPTETRKEGHTPCANWYIEGEGEAAVDGDVCTITASDWSG
jgi:hypothetical protein